MARLETGTPPEAVWTKVADTLRGELGEGPFNSYVAMNDKNCRYDRSVSGKPAHASAPGARM